MVARLKLKGIDGRAPPSHQLALITSLPFVHTARRTYRLNGPMNTLDFSNVSLNGLMIIERSCVNLTI